MKGDEHKYGTNGKLTYDRNIAEANNDDHDSNKTQEMKNEDSEDMYSENDDLYMNVDNVTKTKM